MILSKFNLYEISSKVDGDSQTYLYYRGGWHAVPIYWFTQIPYCVFAELRKIACQVSMISANPVYPLA